MKIAPAWPSTSRRAFMALSTKAVAGTFCTNLIGLTDKAMGIESSQSVINKVRQSHNNSSNFPKHPLSIAWAPNVTSYPLNTEFPYERDKSKVYPVVEEALMLLGLGDLENPLSAIIDVGDKVVIKPNLCSITYYPDPVTHPSILVPIAVLNDLRVFMVFSIFILRFPMLRLFSEAVYDFGYVFICVYRE